MQDFKDLKPKIRKFGAARVPEGRNAFRAPTESKPARKRLRILLPLLALLLAGYPIVSLRHFPRPAPASAKVSRIPSAHPATLDNWDAFRLAAASYPGATARDGVFSAPLPQGGRVVYAINEAMQHRVEKVLSDSRVPYGVFVALEPKTGRVLATVSYSSLQPEWGKGACYSLYPMASLFKIITATAALEEKKVSPDTTFAFNGRLTSQSPRHWRVKGRGAQQMPLSLAMGKSVNPVFGRLAAEVVGRDPLLLYAGRYGFNQNIFPGSPISASRAPAPGTVDELMLMGAGLNHEVKVSPLHAALIMATVANGGVMMTPSLAREIVDEKGVTLYSQKPQALRTVITPETAASLARMLSTTVVSGTSRKAFHDRRGRPMLASLSVAAKTGSIDGTDPAGHYSWFAAYAPMEDPQIAIAALVINQNKWRIKATYVGEQALEAFFR